MHFGGNDLSGATYDLKQLRVSDIPFMPPTRNEFLEVGHRAYDFGGYLKPRTIRVSAMVEGSSSADLRGNLDAISRVLNPQLGLQNLVLDFPNDSRYWSARVSAPVVWKPISPTVVFGTITFIAPDPCAYSDTLTTTSEVITASPQTVEVTPTGSTAYVYPIYRILMSDDLDDDVTIENDNTGETLTITGGWNDTDTYNFDASDMTCDSLVSGYITEITGQWPYLVPNVENDIIVTGLANDATVSVVFRNRYL